MAQTSITEAGIEARLAALAQDRGQPISDLAAEAIAAFVEMEIWQERHIRQGKAELEAGAIVSHERVTEWLDSWGTDNELPAPNEDRLVSDSYF